ncbi:MAG: PAS domain S-box protein [Thermoanaerobaculia bacterium]|nr:PAS domain S-box protein [Thermoanaerobaculia bacterium]
MPEPEAINRSAGTRVPLGLLTLAFALTVLSISWFGWLTHTLSHDAKSVTDASIRIERLRGDMLHLGEALGGTVRLAATTGDATWEERFRRLEPRIEAALAELKSLAGDPATVRSFVQIDESNARLVEMENRAFEMVRAGDTGAARAVIFSDDYAKLELEFVDGIESVVGTARRSLANQAGAQRRASFLALVGALLVGACSVAAWLFAARSLRRWNAERETAIRDRLEAAESLRELNEQLETRVEQRTVELERLNHALRDEAGERERVEETLRRQQTELRVLFDLMPAMIWVKDTNNGILRVNQRVAEAVGRSIAEIEGQSMAEIYPEDAAEFFAEDQQIIRSRAPILGVVEPDRRSDGTRWIQMDKVPYFDDEGQVIGIIVMVRDITELKEAEDALRARNDLFDQMADHINDAFWVRSPDLRELRYISPGFERIWGRSMASLHANPLAWPTFVVEEDRERVQAEFARILSDQPNLDIAYRIVRPDGEIRWIRARAFQVRGSSGELINLTGIATDITEQQRVTSMLRESEERFRSYFELGLVGMVITSPTKGLLEVNDELCRILGYERDELLRRNWAELTHPDDLAADLAQFNRVMAGEIDGYSLDKRYIRGDGAVVDTRISVKCVRRADGGVDSLLAIVEDVTARKRAEATRDRLAAIVEATTDFVGFSDPSGRLLYLNRAGREMLGLNPGEDITRMTIADCLPDPATHPAVTEGLPAAARDGTWIGEVALLHRSGREITASQVILAHRGANGELDYFSTIIRDLTERKRLEARLFQSQKMETIGKLAGGVAHEFNSILTTIVGRSELLVAELPTGGTLARNATEIGEAATRAGGLTRKLLAYSRQQSLRLQRLELNQIIRAMEPAFHLLMSNGVGVRLVLDPCLHTARVDAGQLEEVLVNLAMNATDAMPGGGTFTVETANVTSDDETTGLDPLLSPGDFVMIAITDSGVGMSPAVKARMFEPFFTTKAVGHGTGLGLSTCDGIIKQSGGHIAVDSVPGQGTTVRIYLARDNEQLTDQPRPSGLPSGTETILFVEADRGLREMAAGLLSRLGYSVLAAATEEEALVLIEPLGAEPIDLLLMEAAVSDANGNDLPSRVNAAYPGIRSLFMCAGTADEARLCDSIEGALLLRKPFTPSALAQKVRERLDHSLPATLAPAVVAEV